MKLPHIKLGRIRRLRRNCLGLLFVSFILVGVPLSVLVKLAMAPTIVLTPKWTRTGLGTNWEGGLVIGDVTGDGQEDIVFAGGGSDIIHVLNGVDGSTIATRTITAIGTYVQPQLYDVDGDGVLEILVPLYYPPGLAALKYTGTSTLTQLWSTTIQTAQPGGYGALGSVMAKPVAGDIDGDGNLDIFLASQDVSPADNSSGTNRWNGYTGTIVRLDHLGNIVAKGFSWRACSGGLSLADTDNDGVFEIYQGDRDMDYSDGGYGKGAKSYSADDLKERWIRLDDLTSSQAPALADVNGDGVKDAITGMYNQQWVFNTTNGEAIYHWSNSNLSVHYGTTIYDIDGDGHLEVLANDGDHDDQPYTDVFDLVTGQMDAQLYHFGQLLCTDQNYLEGAEYNHLLGTYKWGPLVADIDPTHPGMEIISAPEGTGLDGGSWWHGSILIWSSNYQSLQNITRRPGTVPGTYSTSRLGSQMGYPFVQDIDSDGLLELVINTSSGHVYAFDSSAPAPGYNQEALPGSQRIRSEVTYYGEARLGVAKHTIMPWEENYWTAPLVAPISPSDNALAVPLSTTQLSFKLREHQSEPLSYSVTTSPNIGSTSGVISSGTYSWNTVNVDVGGLTYDTTYRWTVSASDGTNVTTRTYTFRTQLAPNADNIAPSHGNPTLSPLDGIGMTTSTFQAANQSTFDINGDLVTNVYNWTVNGNPVTRVFLPFNTRDETSTKDYSGFGNDGQVIGATWVPNGRVGGAYSFDGKDDAIIISDGGMGYYDDRTYPAYPNHEELGGLGNWNEVTVEAWIYLTKYNNGSRIVGKIPSYALGFTSNVYAGGTSRIYGAVWPYSGLIAADDNQATTDRMQQVTADVNIQLNTWYHIAFTYKNGTGLKLYFNGQLVNQASTRLGPLSESQGEPLYIGRLVQPFEGMIDEVRIYNYAAPAEQMYNRYMESKDGGSSSSLFYPLGIADPTDTLSVQVIPTDSYTDGSPKSNSALLVNSPPSASQLNITPVRSQPLRLDNENLGASYVYADPDGDLQVGSEIRWFKNSVLQTGLNDSLQVLAGLTTVGDVWYFTVRPRDSRGDFGTLQTSYSVTIRGNIAPTHDTPQLVSSGGTNRDDEDLIASVVNPFDADGDEVTSIYHWIRNGASLTRLLMPFETDTLTSAKDYSGYGNNGVVTGAAPTRDGAVGGAYVFDGSDRIMVAEQGTSLGGDGSWSTMSVEFWVKATANTGTKRLLWFHNASNTNDLAYRLEFSATDTNNFVRWRVYNATGSYTASYYITDGPRAWHHIVATYQSGVGLKIFVDGLLRASVAGAGTLQPVGTGVLEIGYQSGSGDFVGMLDEVRIYNSTLSSAQIFQRFVESKDGLSSSSTMVAQEIDYNEQWKCEVIPNDSFIDGTAKTSNTINVLGAPANGRPRIDVYSPTDLTPELDEGASLNFTQVSSDPDGPQVLYYSWLLDHVEVVTSQNWTYSPLFDAAGVHNVTLKVSDYLGLFDTQQWSVTVNNVNRVPAIDTYYPLTDPVILEGVSQEFNVTYHDLDADPLTVQWYLNGTPTVTADSYTFVADYHSVGAYNVTIAVSDGLAQVSHQWVLTVLENNRSPSIDWFTPTDSTPDVNENSSLAFEHISSDPDDDSLSYSWLLDDFVIATSQNWTYWPDFEASGVHNVTLVVSDGYLSVVQQWSVTVANVNRAPVIDWYYPLGEPVISEGENEDFYVACSDPDGNLLSYQWYLDGTPTVTTDNYDFIAGYGSAGVYNVTVVISDGLNQTGRQWTLTVTIPGDVDLDGDVDDFDLTDVGEAYGSTPELPNWNASCDFDSNNLIDVMDLFSLGKNYGRTVSSLGLSQNALNLATSQTLPAMLVMCTGFLMTAKTADLRDRRKRRNKKPTN